jgi:hypothetical protein
VQGAGCRVQVARHFSRIPQPQVGRAGQPPSVNHPRFDVSPYPSPPWSLDPQHLTVASSCDETSFMSLQGYLAHNKQPPPHRITIGPYA